MESLLHALKENLGLIAAWVGTITLTQVHLTVATTSGLVLIGYTLWKWRKEAKEKK